MGEPKSEKRKYLDYKIVEEPWSVYEFSDGSQLRVRMVVHDIVDSGKRKESGEPILEIGGSTVVAYRPPLPKKD